MTERSQVWFPKGGESDYQKDATPVTAKLQLYTPKGCNYIPFYTSLVNWLIVGNSLSVCAPSVPNPGIWSLDLIMFRFHYISMYSIGTRFTSESIWFNLNVLIIRFSWVNSIVSRFILHLKWGAPFSMMEILNWIPIRRDLSIHFQCLGI